MSEIDVGVGYRKLDPSEKVLEGDEFHDGLRWRPSYNWKPESGGTQADDQPYRRPVPAESFPPLSPEAKDAMTQDGKGMMELVDAVPEATAGERIYTLDEVKAAQAPPFRILTIGDTVSKGDEVYHKGKWRPVPPRHIGWVLKGIREPRRRKTAAGHVADLKTYATATPIDASELERAAESLMSVSVQPHSLNNPFGWSGSSEPEYLARELEALVRSLRKGNRPKDEAARYLRTLLTAMGLPVEECKPFTPNKYTRWIPTLDGRKVPVDVYCVSEAFGLSGCLKSEGAVDACNHAKKKLLAPGQRGVKTALQDIQEAHKSLGRAIQLEEAADAP